MTAHVPNSHNKMTPEAAAKELPAASDQEVSTAAPSAASTDNAASDTVDKPEQAAAPEADPSSKKTENKAKSAGAKKARKDTGAKPKEGPQEDAAKAMGASPPDDKPNLRCLKVIREVAPLLPAGILPSQIEKLFPDPVSRAAPVCALLAAVGAAAGHAVGLATRQGNEQGGMCGLRVAVITDVHSLSSLIAPVLQAAYAVHADETKIWVAEKEKELGQAAVGAVRQRLYRQTAANAAILGFGELADAGATPAAMPAPPTPRPCFVLRDPVPKAVSSALANASKGVLIINGNKMPTMAGWATNYLTDLANLLNNANAGELLELADPLAHGAVRMRGACVSVTGVLSTVETFFLHEAKTKALASTVFVPVEAAPKAIAANAGKVLSATLGRLRALHPENEGELRGLHLSAEARKMFEQAKRKLLRAANKMLTPLAEIYADAADVIIKIAALLHLLDHAIGDADQLPLDIGKDSIVRAIAFVEEYALPAAVHVLGPSSIAPVQRHARRVLSFAQQNLSSDAPLVLNDLARRLVNSMERGEIRKAIGLLVDDGLLSQKTPGGSQSYTIDPVVFAAENRLPDLAGDPRRPKH
jgi:hypothetical protein